MKSQKVSKKAQGLPMQTIAIIIIVVITLVGVLMFFFSTFGDVEGGVEEQNKFSKCQTLCAKIASSSPADEAEAESEAITLEYCNDNCDEYISCEVEIRSSSDPCVLTCAGNRPDCS